MTPHQLIRLRKALKLSQAQLAARLKVNRSTVSKWESGVHKVNGRTVEILRRLKQGGA